MMNFQRTGSRIRHPEGRVEWEAKRRKNREDLKTLLQTSGGGIGPEILSKKRKIRRRWLGT